MKISHRSIEFQMKINNYSFHLMVGDGNAANLQPCENDIIYPIKRCYVVLLLLFKYICVYSLNQTVPYCNMIPGGMSGKRTIVVRGMVPYGAQRYV